MEIPVLMEIPDLNERPKDGNSGNSFKRNWCCVGGELKHNKLG